MVLLGTVPPDCVSVSELPNPEPLDVEISKLAGAVMTMLAVRVRLDTAYVRLVEGPLTTVGEKLKNVGMTEIVGEAAALVVPLAIEPKPVVTPPPFCAST